MKASLNSLRKKIRDGKFVDEASVLNRLARQFNIPAKQRDWATERAVALVQQIRAGGRTGLMEVFLAEYGLSTDEGVALMCLAEALLRVPDAVTIDALIEDKIAPSAWGKHLGQSSSSLVNASTWALLFTGKVLNDEGEGLSAVLRHAVKRLGEPVIRLAVQRAMKELGQQFVLGETIEQAIARGATMTARGYTYSFDMLGEAAMTATDAADFLTAYQGAIESIAEQCTSNDVRENPGISVKLSALHPRYEFSQRERCLPALVDALGGLCLAAKEARMGLNIDAEEADRLDLSLDIIEAVLRRSDLAGWDGFGVVVQAYGMRSIPVIDWLQRLTTITDRRIMVRLVKGAYWDTEIKRAQVEGWPGFPVFTRKAATDVSYIYTAHRLLALRDRIYPQFATHNAHTVASILAIGADPESYEFQRLHGMGEALHELVLEKEKTRCRIYAPVGAHRDLLAYLVRRLLENGANSSFVNQIVDAEVPPEAVAADPFQCLVAAKGATIAAPQDVFSPRRNSQGWDLSDENSLRSIEEARAPFTEADWDVASLTAVSCEPAASTSHYNPARPDDRLGTVADANAKDLAKAIKAAKTWDAPVPDRAAILRRAADLFEENFGEFFAVLAREAGKNLPDAVAELREAVDFLRYYSDEAERLHTGTARGLFACISPWNFPLAIFTGQIASALAAGNGVLAKPAEPTPITAWLAVRLLHDAGVPKAALQLLIGSGRVIGAGLASDPRIKGLAFTGSTETAKRINRAMAANVDPDAVLIAETGGLNAMIVDSTALPEQAVQDILTSAFQSAGQRCSALRVLYVQKDICGSFLEMLFGAMEELVLGDPWSLSTDVGPVITKEARTEIQRYIDIARREGRLLRQLSPPGHGHFIGPAAIRVNGVADLGGEVFGPVLHIATFDADDIEQVVDDINASGYGLTFGMHSRIDDRVETVISRLNVGNIYVNRNQIGAIVGSQPFGGENLSGTGPKAGGPAYVARFQRAQELREEPVEGALADMDEVRNMLERVDRSPELLETVSLPGPTGESNRLSRRGRGTVLCLGPTPVTAEMQADAARQSGCAAVMVVPGVRGEFAVNAFLPRETLSDLQGIAAVALASNDADLREARIALARRDGPLVPLLNEADIRPRCVLERHVCIDTTAAGGNAALLAGLGS